ncbi:MAG TPA: hypothetical protein VF273_04315 [Pelobium sp.]
MINVQYQLSDLAKALLKLLPTLNDKDWNKKTLLKNQTVYSLSAELLQFYIGQLTAAADNTLLCLAAADTTTDLSLIKKRTELLLNLLKIKASVGVSEKVYAQAWLAQQYIYQSLNNQELLQPNFYYPFLTKVMKALVKHYQSVDAADGTAIKIEIVGASGGSWTIKKTATSWKLIASAVQENSIVYIDQQIAWLLFTGALHVNEIGQFYQIIGDQLLGRHFLTFRTDLAFAYHC